MNEAPTHSRSSFAMAARQQVRTALELAAQRSPENASRIAADLGSLSTRAAALGLVSIAQLAQRASEQARLVASDPSAVTACARTLRELGRALEVLAREPAPPPVAAETARRDGRKVLVVDDSSLNAAVVCDALERAAFETRHSEDGDSAVLVIGQFQPDIVLADVHMPGSTPTELCARMRAAAGARSLHILLFSGLSDAALAELTVQARADGFVSKGRGLGAVVEEVTKASRSVAR